MKKQFIFIIIEGIIASLFGLFKISFPCIFKSIFHIPCPGCGMTRAFYAILNFHVLESFQYNVLAFPFFLLICIINMVIIIDFIFHKNICSIVFKIIEKNYYVLLILAIISEVINLYRGI